MVLLGEMKDADKEEIDETGLFVFTMQCFLSNKRISKSGLIHYILSYLFLIFQLQEYMKEDINDKSILDSSILSKYALNTYSTHIFNQYNT